MRRISFGAGRYTAPVWSPDGQLIAFVKQQGQSFSIGVMKPDGSGERILTTSYFADEPTWAPNGRVIMFERKMGDGASRLWTVDVTGHIQKEAPLSGLRLRPGLVAAAALSAADRRRRNRIGGVSSFGG